MCTMAINNEFNGIELTFAGKPAEEIREAMKAAGFRWHRQKKLWYAKNTAERMELAKKLSGDASPAQVAAASVSSSSEPVSKYGLKVGDILSGSWGYSMTIVEFYKVVKIVSPCRVEIAEIGSEVVRSDRGGGENLMPDPDRVIGEPVIKNVMKNRYSSDENDFYIKINDSCNIRPWSGRPMYQNTWD